MFDLLIERGLLIDGTGSPGFHGSVGVRGDTLYVVRGDTSGLSAGRRIDAGGLVISPGFVDIHAHSGLLVLADKAHEAKVLQGVTTELVGVDGLSYAPFRSNQDLLAMVRMNAGLDGDPPLDYAWGTVSEYLQLFDQQSPANTALLIGNTPLRINAIGWSDVTSTTSTTAGMRAMLRAAMEEGAFGLSSGLDYPPGCFADTDELVALAREAASLGGIYHTHVRYSLGDRYLDPHREAIEIGRKAGAAVHITHLAPRNSYPSAYRLLQLVESAASENLDITFDAIPLYPGSTRILILFPYWVQDGGPYQLLERLADPSARARLRDEVGPGPDATWDEMWMTNFIVGQNQSLSGLTIARAAALRSQHPVDMLCDLLVEEELRVTFSYMNADVRNLPRYLAHPLAMAASDAVLLGEHPPPRTYATFVSMLSDYSRDEPVMSLPEAIRKMTSMPAQRIGLPDRGILRDGFKADLVVFDPERVGLKTRSANPQRNPEGIPHVIVNGVHTVDEGKRTSATPGRALKRV